MSKKNSKKTVPELRFRGFTDPWEQRQLGDIAERVARRNSNNECTRVLTASAESGLVDQQEYFLKRIASPDLTNYYLLRRGDFAYNHSSSANAPFGIVRRLDTYDSGCLSSLYIVFRPFSDVDSDFLLQYFESSAWHNDVSGMVTEGARNHGLLNISSDAFFTTHCTSPHIPEQRLIGEFFSTLDSLIAAAERQEALLRQKKQAYLQLIFPREGETEPRLRFAGFSGEWETQRFGEIFQYERPDAYLADDDEIEDEGAIPVLTANKAFILGYTNSLQGIYRKGRCIIFDDFTLDSKRVDQPFKVRSSAIKILTVRENEDFDFAFELLRTSKFPLLGHARHYIAVVQPQATLIPHSLQEQQHIGRFFRNFDSLIACAEKRVASLRTLKSAYLQRMFV